MIKNKDEGLFIANDSWWLLQYIKNGYDGVSEQMIDL